MVIVENSIQELQRMLEQRDDVPRFFADSFDVQRPKADFREYKNNYDQCFFETTRDNGSLYPSKDSYAPYLEMV